MPGQKWTTEIPNARARTSVPTFIRGSHPPPRTKTLGLKLNLGMDRPDNGVAVATSVQKVGLINFADGLFL